MNSDQENYFLHVLTKKPKKQLKWTTQRERVNVIRQQNVSPINSLHLVKSQVDLAECFKFGTNLLYIRDRKSYSKSYSYSLSFVDLVITREQRTLKR